MNIGFLLQLGFDLKDFLGLIYIYIYIYFPFEVKHFIIEFWVGLI